MPDEALEGVKVVDLTHYIAGPYCTKLMADLGAEVIKIERPGTGDPARRLGPFPGDEPHPEKSGFYLYLNTSKKSVTLNLKSRLGLKLLKRLIAEADILVENFSPRVLPSLGLDYDTLRQINPRLVVTSISNFGQTGPYRDHKASDMGLLALGGLMAITGEADREPLKNYGFQASYHGGHHGFIAAMIAYWAALEDGQGQHVDVSIYECINAILEPPVHWAAHQGLGYYRRGNRGAGHPWGVFPAKDGYTGVVAGPAEAWSAFAAIFENEALADPKYEDRLARLAFRDEIDGHMLPYLLSHGKKEIYHRGQTFRAAFGYVATTEDLLEDPQLVAREFFVEIDHPEAGRQTYPGAPYRMTESPWRARRAPLLGEHNAEILGNRLGISREELVRMRQNGII